MRYEYRHLILSVLWGTAASSCSSVWQVCPILPFPLWAAIALCLLSWAFNRETILNFINAVFCINWDDDSVLILGSWHMGLHQIKEQPHYSGAYRRRELCRSCIWQRLHYPEYVTTSVKINKLFNHQMGKQTEQTVLNRVWQPTNI